MIKRFNEWLDKPITEKNYFRPRREVMTLVIIAIAVIAFTMGDIQAGRDYIGNIVFLDMIILATLIRYWIAKSNNWIAKDK